MEIVKEGSAKVMIPKSSKVSKDMGVFYNPIMSLNRDISILLLKCIDKNNMQIADPLAASGIRSIRFLKEIKASSIKKIYVNDYDKKSANLIKKNFRLNKLKWKYEVSNNDANLFLLNSTGFDYIDIDPFGTPNPFLDSACRRLARNGILAVTATDTSALAGTYPKACKRKYWAIPKKGPLMHEIGLRILIRKVQLVAAQYDKALVPIFSYSKEHYMRAFFRNEKGKNSVDGIIKQHGNFNGAGPMWLGNLWDKKLCGKMYKNSEGFNSETEKFLKLIKDESKINSVGFYDMHHICSKNKIRKMPTNEAIMKKIRKKGYKASNTHFKGYGVRSNISLKELLKIMR